MKALRTVFIDVASADDDGVILPENDTLTTTSSMLRNPLMSAGATRPGNGQGGGGGSPPTGEVTEGRGGEYPHVIFWGNFEGSCAEHFD